MVADRTDEDVHQPRTVVYVGNQQHILYTSQREFFYFSGVDGVTETINDCC
jgi:hypothetical protein